ncbi:MULTISPECIES: alpha/beta family hydrolase [Pseudomonas]|uniref:alpha/beta family hydrolase n=1 Tax=Pseudomonas TaxID=286 RepID=UPI0030028AFD
MSSRKTQELDQDQQALPQSAVSLLTDNPVGPARATFILAHGAGAPMDSEFMQSMAALLAQRGIQVVRFEFAYMAARRTDGKKRPPNPQARLLEQWRDVYRKVREQVAGPLLIGGKSMGGRMASLLADELGADGLVCLGYPFYAAGKQDKPRTAHLADLRTPTLIVQGERDIMGNFEAVAGYSLSDSIRLHWLKAGDHDLKPLKSSGFSHADHMLGAAQAISDVVDELAQAQKTQP